jgi:hypothetical protein
MENRAESPLMSRLVRKASVDGRAVDKSNSTFLSGSGSFFPLRNFFEDLSARIDPSESIDARTIPSVGSFAFFLERKRFILPVLTSNAVLPLD